MISAPKEHNKSIKASHTINRCNWLYFFCVNTIFLYYDVYYIVRIRHTGLYKQILITMRINKHLNPFIYVLLGIILGVVISFMADMYMQYNHEKEMQIQDFANLPSLEEAENRIDEIRQVDTIKTLSYISCGTKPSSSL